MPDRSPNPSKRPAGVLLDALGTTVQLDPPAPPLARALGVELDERLRDAVRAEMRHYRAHAIDARDESSLAALRERCAEIVADGIGRPVSVDQLMAAISFRAYEDAGPALERLRAAGIRTACVSNWDIALPRVLARAGLADLFDVVITSAEAGAAKPDPAPFEIALARLGLEPSEVIHVGDTEAEDLAGARAAGIEALLIERMDAESRSAGSIASLTELADRLAAAGPDPGF
ncbi:HAD-IA family hydrolase [Thermoleophilia bacterium SCSIO 60948]|nr:HAD-IA family hydrolase [Thermoleophilia bacterium SCSIO 60948]